MERSIIEPGKKREKQPQL